MDRGYVDKEYLEREYQNALSDFTLSESEEGRWVARKAMARLEEIAARVYGFDYAKELNGRAKAYLREEGVGLLAK